MKQRLINDHDVILREGAVENFRNIATKFDQHRIRTMEEEQEDTLSVSEGKMDTTTFYRRRAERKEELVNIASTLLHGLSYMLEAAKGGSIVPEDDTNLIGSGWLTVGLIDHGTEWSAHS